MFKKPLDKYLQVKFQILSATRAKKESKRITRQGRVMEFAVSVKHLQSVDYKTNR